MNVCFMPGHVISVRVEIEFHYFLLGAIRWTDTLSTSISVKAIKGLIYICIPTADQFEMSLEELYMKVTNEHLPPRVRKLLPDPISGIMDPEPVSSEWRQFAKVGEDQAETVKVRLGLKLFLEL